MVIILQQGWAGLVSDQMERTSVWYPRRSLLEDEGEEGPARPTNTVTANSKEQKLAGSAVVRRTARIVRRRQPTVDVSACRMAPQSTIAGDEGSPTGDEDVGGYSTVENNPRSSLDRVPALREAGGGDQQMAEACGWRPDEHTFRVPANRTCCKATGPPREFPSNRLLYGGRQVASRAGKRRVVHQFKHLKSVDDHITHYSSLVCSTAPTTARPEEEVLLAEEEGVVERSHTSAVGSVETQITKTLRAGSRKPSSRVITGRREGDLMEPLAELANRIGVQKSIKYPQLLKSKTPASITKKTGQRDDLVL